GLPAIEPQPRPESIPLSFAQQRLWFLDQLEGKSSTYNITNVFELRGQLNLEALESALASLSYRQEILRTNFIAADGQPRQCVGEVKSGLLEAIDLEDLPAEEKTAAVERLVAENSGYKFALDRDNLVRSQIIFLGEDTYLLLLTLHHLIADDWSMNIFFRELSVLYAANIQGQPSPILPLTIQYADFALWQHQWFSPQFLEPQLNYWRQQLRDLPPLLDLPTDKPRPSLQSFRGATRFFQLPALLRGRLKEFARRSGATEYMILVTAFAVLLSRYSGQKDIALGTVIANRNRGEIESLIGFFANTLVLRLNLEDNPSFVEGVAQARRVALEAYAHQDLPFQDVLGALRPQRSSSYHPLFQHMFVWQNAPRLEWQMPGLTISQRQIDTGRAKFDITLVMEERGESIVGEWIYSTDLFVAETIERMLAHFQCLLEAALSHPEARVETLPMLTQSEKYRLLRQWNCTHTDYPRDFCIHHLFEEQVSLAPDAVALVFEGQHLTYAQLNQLSNQLAHYLRDRGVKPEVLVGLCLKRSLDLIVGILGILKAGGAYLPLDPDYPSERLAFILEDTGVKIILSQDSLLDKLPDSGLDIICLDSDRATIQLQKDNNPISEATADNLAYVIYTSGTTGNPKGVCVIHRGVTRLVKGNNYARLNEEEIFLQLAPITFDAATFEIWGSLLNGARLVLFPGDKPSVAQLARTIEAHGITTLWLTAGLFHLIVDEGLKSLKSLRQLLAGGDVLSIPHVLRFIGEATNCRLINGYGPTENTTFTCCYTVTRSEWGSNSLPIGTAIANTRVYILDAHLQPVPVGVTGEIYIGGDGLARGYLNRPELTREKFIDAPSWNDEGIFPVPTTERLYKTGDLARYLPDGNIEFSGRIDNQVKIRGFRVETGEIEAVLTQHPAVRETVVVAMNDSSNNKYLVAYVVIRDAISLPSGELRRFSGEKLPEYMIPSAFVQLPVIPLTPNGKIDRSALLQLDLARQLPEKQFVAPRDEWELRLREIWENLLQVKPISIHDDFFSLGGNSLLALRLLARLEKVFQSEISLKALFQLSTIEQLAITLRSGEEARLESSDRTQSLLSNSPGLSLNERRGLLASTITRKRVLDTSSLIMLERSGDGESRPPLFFVYLIGELGKHFAESQRVYNLTVWCQIETPKTFIQALANHYVEEIRKIQPSGPYVIGGYCFGGLVALEIAQQLQCQGQTVSLLILIETPNQDYFYNRRRGALRRLGYNNFLQLKYNYRVFNRLEIAEKYNWLRQKIKNLFGSKYDTGKNNYQREEKLDKQDYSDDKILASMQLATVNYKPKSYWGDVALIFGSEGSIYSPLFPWAGWGKIFKGKVSLELIPGTHTSILKDPDVKLLGEVLEKLLNSTRYN
ncbi:MAG: amino acid adenylation domain-containing protein, partial [Chlorogloea purpurea SAG 13.99]|nr:amino acid adenylation domain-containing protein [Chlorogloea purpurea SAG 13.99]